VIGATTDEQTAVGAVFRSAFSPASSMLRWLRYMARPRMTLSGDAIFMADHGTVVLGLRISMRIRALLARSAVFTEAPGWV
jgi:hypothetical protein